MTPKRSKSPSGHKRYLILPDAHIPYHDKRALEGLVLGKVLPAGRFHGVVILGDWFDNYGVSTYTKDPTRLKGLQQELALGFDLLKRVEDAGFKVRIFIEGNHERRLPRFLADRAPEVYEMVMEWWGTRFSKWIYVPYMDDIQLGKLFITHDVGRAGEHSTKQSMFDYQDNLVIGHNHRMDYTVRANAKGIAHVGASFGWLGDTAKIDYRHRMKCRRDWVLGIGTLLLREDGLVHVRAHPIINYSLEMDGVIYRT